MGYSATKKVVEQFASSYSKRRFAFVNTTDYLGLFTATDIFNHVKIKDRRKDINEGETSKT